jgi:hypothetical protein
MSYELGSLGADWSGTSDQQIPTRKVDLKTVKRQTRAQFIPSIPLEWFTRVCTLPGKALAVALVIWRLAKMKKKPNFVLSQAALNRHGINRWAKYSALKALESAGVIAVDRRQKKNPVVTPLWSLK